MYMRRFILGLGVLLGCTTYLFYYVQHSGSIDRGPNHTGNKNYQVPKKTVMEQPNNTDVYFSIKTTERNYEERLMLLMMTWFEVVKNKVARA